jgi:hypothetical protein
MSGNRLLGVRAFAVSLNMQAILFGGWAKPT